MKQDEPCLVCGGAYCADRVHGEIDYRSFRRVPGRILYTFPAAGGWARRHNQRKKPLETRKAKRVRK